MAEVATACGVVTRSVREWIARGKLRAFQPYHGNKAYRVSAEAFAAFLTEHGQAYPKASEGLRQ